MIERLVVDASVAAKWVLTDSFVTHVDKAEEILIAALAGEWNLHAPSIFRYEVCGTFTKACGQRRLSEKVPRLRKDLATQAISDVFSWPVRLESESEDDVVKALDLAVSYSKGFYDMLYLGLAQKLNCCWCTADAKLLRAIPPAFPKDQILLLSDWTTGPQNI